jgi:hypothetical protein
MPGRSVVNVREGKLRSVAEPRLKSITPRAKGASYRSVTRLGRLTAHGLQWPDLLLHTGQRYGVEEPARIGMTWGVEDLCGRT